MQKILKKIKNNKNISWKFIWEFIWEFIWKKVKYSPITKSFIKTNENYLYKIHFKNEKDLYYWKIIMEWYLVEYKNLTNIELLNILKYDFSIQ